MKIAQFPTHLSSTDLTFPIVVLNENTEEWELYRMLSLMEKLHMRRAAQVVLDYGDHDEARNNTQLTSGTNSGLDCTIPCPLTGVRKPSMKILRHTATFNVNFSIASTILQHIMVPMFKDAKRKHPQFDSFYLNLRHDCIQAFKRVQFFICLRNTFQMQTLLLNGISRRDPDRPASPRKLVGALKPQGNHFDIFNCPYQNAILSCSRNIPIITGLEEDAIGPPIAAVGDGSESYPGVFWARCNLIFAQRSSVDHFTRKSVLVTELVTRPRLYLERMRRHHPYLCLHDEDWTPDRVYKAKTLEGQVVTSSYADAYGEVVLQGCFIGGKPTTFKPTGYLGDPSLAACLVAKKYGLHKYQLYELLPIAMYSCTFQYAVLGFLIWMEDGIPNRTGKDGRPGHLFWEMVQTEQRCFSGFGAGFQHRHQPGIHGVDPLDIQILCRLCYHLFENLEVDPIYRQHYDDGYLGKAAHYVINCFKSGKKGTGASKLFPRGTTFHGAEGIGIVNLVVFAVNLGLLPKFFLDYVRLPNTDSGKKFKDFVAQVPGTQEVPEILSAAARQLQVTDLVFEDIHCEAVRPQRPWEAKSPLLEILHRHKVYRLGASGVVVEKHLPPQKLEVVDPMFYHQIWDDKWLKPQGIVKFVNKPYFKEHPQDLSPSERVIAEHYAPFILGQGNVGKPSVRAFVSTGERIKTLRALAAAELQFDIASFKKMVALLSKAELDRPSNASRKKGRPNRSHMMMKFLLHHPVPSDDEVAVSAVQEFNRFNRIAMKNQRITEERAKHLDPFGVEDVVKYADDAAAIGLEAELGTVPVLRMHKKALKASEPASSLDEEPLDLQDLPSPIHMSPFDDDCALPSPRDLFSPTAVPDGETPQGTGEISQDNSEADSSSGSSQDDAGGSIAGEEETPTGGKRKRKPSRRARKKARLEAQKEASVRLPPPGSSNFLEPSGDVDRFVFMHTSLDPKVTLPSIKQWTENPTFVLRQNLAFWSQLGMGKCSMHFGALSAGRGCHTSWLEISRHGEDAGVLAMCDPQQQLRWSEALCPKTGRNIILDYFLVPPVERKFMPNGDLAFYKKSSAEMFLHLTTFLLMEPEGRNRVASKLFSKYVGQADFSDPVSIRIEHDAGENSKEQDGAKVTITLFHFVTIPKYKKDKKQVPRKKSALRESVASDESKTEEVRAWLMLAPLPITSAKNYLFVDMGELKL